MYSTRNYLLIFCLSFLLTGCAFTTMQTSRQLDKGEVVYSGALDWPGAFFVIPRASGQVTYGFGAGDISGHVGTAMFTLNAGASARAYLARWLTASLQGDFMWFPLEDTFFFFGGDTSGAAFITLSPRLTTATVEGDLFYGGVQSNVIFGIGTGTNGIEPGFALFGVVGGIEYVLNDKIALQAELSLSPVALTMMDSSSSPSIGPVPVAQLGVGFNWGSGRPAKSSPGTSTPIPQTSPPSQQQAPEPVPAEASQPDETPPASAPVFDNDGVPLY